MKGALLRIFIAMAFAMASFNPSGYSLYHLVAQNYTTSIYPVVIGGVVWLGCLYYLVNTTIKTLGPWGLLFIVGVPALLIAWATDGGWIDPTNPTIWGWLIPPLVGGVMGVGLTGTYINRLLSDRRGVDSEDPDT